MGRPLQVLIIVLLASPTSAGAWSQLHSDAGVPLAWCADNPFDNGGPYIPLVGNALNRGDVSTVELREAVLTGLAAWEEASDGAFRWDYWQGDDLERFPVTAARDGVSTISFAVAGGGTGVPYSAAARTQVWWDEELHCIREVDIVLNDVGFDFSTDPADAEYGGGLSNRLLILQDVITHELGHALGLDHSGVPDATMFAWGWAGQHTPDCDDVSGVRSVFGVQEDVTGSVSGYVLRPDRTPVFGAALTLIDRASARAVASVLSDRTGRYTVDAPPGEYFVFLEPWLAGPVALGTHYADVWHRECFDAHWSREVLTYPDGVTPRLWTVAAGEQTTLQPVTVSCGEGGALVTPFGTDELWTAPQVIDGALQDRFAFMDAYPDHDWRHVQLRRVQGDLRIDVLAWSLFSPVYTDVRLIDAHGDLVGTLQRPVRDEEDTGFVAWDSRFEADDLPLGDYVLAIRANPLPQSAWPRGDLYLDEQPFVLVSGGVGDPATEPGCQVTATLPAYTSPPGGPRAFTWPVPEEEAGCSLTGGSSSGLALPLLAGLVAGVRRRTSRPR